MKYETKYRQRRNAATDGEEAKTCYVFRISKQPKITRNIQA